LKQSAKENVQKHDQVGWISNKLQDEEHHVYVLLPYCRYGSDIAAAGWKQEILKQATYRR
jgi:hypothetical protein